MPPRRHFARHNDDTGAKRVASFCWSKSGAAAILDAAIGETAAIAELPWLARRILVYLGERQLRTEDGIDIWPLDRFTAAAADGSLWPYVTTAHAPMVVGKKWTTIL